LSKGLGRIEQAVLAAAHGEVTMFGLMWPVFGTSTPTQSQQVSLRRAVRSLERKGLVETFPWDGPGPSRRAVRRPCLRGLPRPSRRPADKVLAEHWPAAE
jgi:hypothetical protein